MTAVCLSIEKSNNRKRLIIKQAFSISISLVDKVPYCAFYD